MNEQCLEKDWQLFKRRIGDWQEKYIAKLLNEYSTLINDDKKNPSEKFWELNERINSDKDKCVVICRRSRSELYNNIYHLYCEGAITDSDLDGFSEDILNYVYGMNKLKLDLEGAPKMYMLSTGDMLTGNANGGNYKGDITFLENRVSLTIETARKSTNADRQVEIMEKIISNAEKFDEDARKSLYSTISLQIKDIKESSQQLIDDMVLKSIVITSQNEFSFSYQSETILPSLRVSANGTIEKGFSLTTIHAYK